MLLSASSKVKAHLADKTRYPASPSSLSSSFDRASAESTCPFSFSSTIDPQRRHCGIDATMAKPHASSKVSVLTSSHVVQYPFMVITITGLGFASYCWLREGNDADTARPDVFIGPNTYYN